MDYIIYFIIFDEYYKIIEFICIMIYYVIVYIGLRNNIF